MIRVFQIPVFCSAVVLAITMSELNADEVEPRRTKAKEAVEARLAKVPGADNGELLDVSNQSLSRSFKDCEFFVLRFRQYPVTVVPPEPFQQNNVFVVAGGEVIGISNEKELVKFFREHLNETADDEARSQATVSWLAVAQELHQDGFFKFKPPVVQVGASVSEGVIEVVPERGDKGKLTVEMEFGDGNVRSIQTGGKLIPGIRPRCQATRLLDKDPVVREVMRRDILVMGRACRSYLTEARDQASPELKLAIDQIWQQILDEGR